MTTLTAIKQDTDFFFSDGQPLGCVAMDVVGGNIPKFVTHDQIVKLTHSFRTVFGCLVDFIAFGMIERIHNESDGATIYMIPYNQKGVKLAATDIPVSAKVEIFYLPVRL